MKNKDRQHKPSHEWKHSQGEGHWKSTKDMGKRSRRETEKSAERRGVIKISEGQKEQTAYDYNHRLLRGESWEDSNPL